MKFKVGDKVRVTRDWDYAKAGMEGEVVCPETDTHGPFIRFPGWDRGHDGSLGDSKSLLPKGSTEGYYIPENNLELIPTEQEKPVEQVYEVGGTLTDARGVVHLIGRFVNGRADIGEGFKDSDSLWVDPTHYVYTPPVKPVPMTRELQEAIERYLDYAGVPTPTEVGEYSTFYAAYQKAKDAAK